MPRDGRTSPRDGHDSEVQWLTHTRASDHGRDVSAYRMRDDPLSGLLRERLIVQCKHWLSKSVNDKDIGAELVAITHWDDPPVDVLIVATSGKFTSDGVAFAERRNSRGERPRIELWNDAHLETKLAASPDIRALYDL